jgi:phosphoribosylformylglycinamidine cyclo-ligase
VAETVVRGITNACKESGCELLGGETAEMPGFYKPEEYDLAGFAVGVVDRDKKLNARATLKAGDILLGLPSSGLHSNGYSLARQVFPRSEWKEKADWLLAPTKLYVKTALNLIAKLNKGKQQKVKGLVHVTGGGFIDNIPRILPKHLSAFIKTGSWPILPVFAEIQKRAELSDAEMFRTFNMGIGLVIAVDPKSVEAARKLLKSSFIIGSVDKGSQDVRFS